MKKYFLVLFFFATAAIFAQTENVHPIDKKMSDCMDADGSTMGMVACINEAYTSWDKELNIYYNKLFKALEPAAKKALKETQLQWIKLQQKNDAMISAIYSSQDGTIVQIQVSEAKMNFVKHRALELKYLFDGISPDAL